jgi:hypothetical protein
MRMRARRRFTFSSWDHALEVRLSPAIVSLHAPLPAAPPTHVSSAPGDDPLPEPQPTPGT